MASVRVTAKTRSSTRRATSNVVDEDLLEGPRSQHTTRPARQLVVARAFDACTRLVVGRAELLVQELEQRAHEPAPPPLLDPLLDSLTKPLL